jgi:hypothetical protein
MRHYLRRIMHAKRTENATEMWDFHMEQNKLFFKEVTTSDILDAIIDGIFVKLKLRPQWYPYPW